MRGKFIPIVPEELTFLQSYNCQREKPRVNTMPAEKQVSMFLEFCPLFSFSY